MKRGVPPTARKARTGELTPPGMTRWARSNSASLLGTRGAQWTWRVPADSPSPGRPRPRLAFLARRQRPEEAVGIDVAHAGRKPASSAWSRKASASPTAACSSLPAPAARPARPTACRRRRRSCLEALELLAGDRALRRGQHVVEELVGQRHAR
jgi:hypothetical protein